MITENGKKVIETILGNDFLEHLEKSEVTGGLVKLNTLTALPPEEIKIALQIVPRTILSFLFANLRPKKENESCDLPLPFSPNSFLHVDKKGPDNYSGYIVDEGKKKIEFKHRSLPGIGLMLLTTFELYDLSLLDEVKNKQPEAKEQKLQDIIDERLQLHSLIQSVVDNKISQREAINKLITERLQSHIMSLNTEPQEHEEAEDDFQEEEYEEIVDKKSKLRQFIEDRNKTSLSQEDVEKSEINCPDCTAALYKKADNKISLCICYGDFYKKEIDIKKSQKTGEYRLKFPKSFDSENIEMLLEAIKNKGI